MDSTVQVILIITIVLIIIGCERFLAKINFNRRAASTILKKRLLIIFLSTFFSSEFLANPEPTSDIIQFEFQSESILVLEQGFSEAMAWGDYDNDGFEDVYVSNGWGNHVNFLYKNDGEGGFEKVTNILTDDKSNSLGANWVDFDNDGDLDLFLCNKLQKNSLYENKGNSEFEKLNCELTIKVNYTTSSAWVDYDLDGFIDCFITNYDNQPNYLYRNLGDGKFEEINGTWSTESLSSLNATWSDFNNDGYPDLFVGNRLNNDIYVNQNGNLVKLSLIPTQHANTTYTVCLADFNNDSWLDLLEINWFGKNKIFTNNQQGDFTQPPYSDYSQELENSEGGAFGDYDNDGDLDLFVTNDGLNSMFENIEFTFHSTTVPQSEDDLGNSNGVFWVDYDKNGTQDLFITNGGNQDNQFFLNNGNENNWILINCLNEHGSPAIGTKIRIKPTGSSEWQMREINSQSCGGYGGHAGFIQHFGLASATSIDSLKIEWLGGKAEVITNIEANKEHSFKQSPSTNDVAFVKSDKKNTVYPVPSSGLVTLVLPKNEVFQLALFSPNRKLIIQERNIQGTTTFNWNHLTAGVYFIKLQSDQSTLLHKFIIQ